MNAPAREPPRVVHAYRFKQRLRTALTIGAGLFASVITTGRAAEPREIDAVFAEWNKPSSPGVALAVIRDGRIIYERGYGQADLEQRTPITPATAFYIGSVSKQFTAAAIALLAQRKAISLEDDVRKYVPELPDYGTPITVSHCVHHTSGLRDYLGLRDLAGEDGNATFGDSEVLALLCRQKALNFPPGTRHLYSNSGYFILSLIVKRAAGRSLREFAAAELFGPLEMKTAQFRDDHRLVIPNRANGYSAANGSYRVNNPNFDVVGAGGAFMTVRDFLAWDRNFYDAKLGGKALIAQLQTPGRLTDGSALTYAFGLTVGRYRGLEIVEHNGSYGGFRASVIRFPDQRFSVVCFGNLASLEPSRLTRKIADLYLGESFTAPATDTVTVAAAGAGAGAGAKTGKKNAAGKGPSIANATPFLGEYHSDELNVTYRISAVPSPGGMRLERVNRPAVPLSRISADAFTAGAFRLAFTRDASGRPTSFMLDSGRARGLVFNRQ